MEKPADNADVDRIAYIFKRCRHAFDTFTSKYVVELALGTSSRIRLAVICLLLIVGEFMSKYIENETKDYRGYVGYFKFVHHMTRKCSASICQLIMKTTKVVITTT